MKWLIAVVATFAFSVTSLAHAGNRDVTFVSTYEELNAALELAASGSIGSVAINQDMYRNRPKHTMTSVRALIDDTLKLGDRAVYIYGSPLDPVLAGELINVGKVDGCVPSHFLGVQVNERGTPVFPMAWSCDTDRGDLSEEQMRKAIQNFGPTFF